MATAWMFFRPEGAAAHRRLAALAPIYIAGSIGIVIAALIVFSGDFRRWQFIIGLCGAVLAVGYFHAGIVIAEAEGSAAIARRSKRSLHRDRAQT